MFRMTRYIKTLMNPSPVRTVPKPSGPVVIWNLIRRCNLTCKHCYSISADIDFKGELSTEEVYTVMDDLKAYGVPVLILSRSEEHTSELQSRPHLVCRLLLEKKKKQYTE